MKLEVVMQKLHLIDMRNMIRFLRKVLLYTSLRTPFTAMFIVVVSLYLIYRVSLNTVVYEYSKFDSIIVDDDNEIIILSNVTLNDEADKQLAARISKSDSMLYYPCTLVEGGNKIENHDNENYMTIFKVDSKYKEEIVDLVAVSDNKDIDVEIVRKETNFWNKIVGELYNVDENKY